MRHQLASVHELAQIGLLAALPGESLGRLAARMEREQILPGEEIAGADRFYAVLAGMLSASGRGMLRPGDTFWPREGRVKAVTPATVASCDRATFEELVKPLVRED